MLADNPHTSELLVGVNKEHIQSAMEDDRTGEARAAVVYHALSRLIMVSPIQTCFLWIMLAAAEVFAG